MLYRSSILWKLVLKTGSYKYQNEKYLKYKIATNVIFQHVWGPQKNLTPFRPVFKPFFDISHEIFAIVQKALILHFRDPSIIVALGK